MVFGKFATDREERINYDRMRKYRLGRAKEQVKKHGLGALLTWDPTNIRYVTGAYILVPSRKLEPNFVLLPKNGDPYLYGGSGGPWDSMREQLPWLKDKIYPRVLPWLRLARTKEQLHNLVKEIANIMDEHGVKNEPLGIDGTVSQLLVQEAFKDVGINVIDAKQTMYEARRIKSQDEIECLRIACANTEVAFADMKDAIRPGVTEGELVGIGMETLHRLGDDEVPEFVCASGEHTNPIRHDFTDRQIRPGDLIYVDITGSSFQGYRTCVYRTFCCGKATAEQKELHEQCRDMLYAGMSAVKAGNTVLDILEKWPTDPHHWGYDKWEQVPCMAVGHGIGMDAHEPPWIHPDPEFGWRENIKLEENMVLALEPYAGKKGGKDGVRLEEMVVVTKDGYDLLTKFPVDELIECWT